MKVYEFLNPATLWDLVIENDDAMVREDGGLTKLAKKGRQGKINGTKVTFDKVTIDRGLAPFTDPDGDPHEVNETDESTETFDTVSIVLERGIPARDVAINKRAFSDDIGTALFNTDAARRIEIYLAEMVGQARRSREEFMKLSYFKPSGFSTQDIGGSKIKTEFAWNHSVVSIPNGEKWDDAATPVLSSPNHMIAIHSKLNEGGRAPYQFISDDTITAALMGNTQVAGFANNQAAGLKKDFLTNYLSQYNQEAEMKGADPWGPQFQNTWQGLGNIPWWIQMTHGYASSGTFKKFLTDPDGKGKGIVLPEDLTNCIGYAEAPAFVPSELYGRLIGTSQLIKEAFTKQYGLVVYAYMSAKAPWKIILHVEIHFGFAILAPKRVLLVDKILAD